MVAAYNLPVFPQQRIPLQLHLLESRIPGLLLPSQHVRPGKGTVAGTENKNDGHRTW